MGVLQHRRRVGASMMGQNTFYQTVPLEIVGSSKFGRTPKMSSEQTFNMIISDGWFVPFGGWQPFLIGSETAVGRAIFSSQTFNRLFSVINNKIYYVGQGLDVEFIGLTQTSSGDVFIEENNGAQVIFSDKKNLYVYVSAATNSFTTLTSESLGFVPGNVTYQNGRFVTVDLSSNQWRLSDANSAGGTGGGLSWPNDSQHVGAIETKPGKARGVIRFPGAGNKILVFGENVAEIWQDVGAALFPYQRDQSANIDFGLANTATLDGNDHMVCWVGINEKSGPAIMYTLGNTVNSVSTDGIDERLAELQFPEECFGFMLKLVGHVCYLVTWPKDNLTYMYDFETQAFFTMTDENMDALIIKQVAFFNNQYWFVSIKDGSLYQLSTNYPYYDYGNGKKYEIPLIRVLPSFNLPDQSAFVARNPAFMIEQGNFDYKTNSYDLNVDPHRVNNVPRVDLTMSIDGGENYSSAWAQEMQPAGQRLSQFQWNDSLGRMNDLTLQFRFHGFSGKFVCQNGTMGVFQ